MAEVPLNPDLVEANKKNEPYGTISKDDIIDFYGRLLGLKVRDGEWRTRVGAAIDYAVRRMPDEYKWGTVNEKGIISNEALQYVDISAYLEQSKTEGDGNNLDDEFDEAINAANRFREIELPELAAADQAAATQATMQPAPSGGYMINPEEIRGMSAQEYAQTYRDTTLLDLGLDKTLRLGLSGVMAGGAVGGDDGIDVYEASRWLYSLTPEQVGQLQIKLANAGYFDQVGQSYSQVNSADDPATRMAWDLFLVDVVRSGSEAKPQDVLNKRIEGYLSSRRPAEGMVFTDEATLQSLGNDFARALVGRDLDYSELQSFYKMARQWEREAALGVTFAQENEQVDVRARAEAYFDRELRLEQAKQIAFDWASKFE